jgi:regulator of cell morphogenesis and NO signaling
MDATTKLCDIVTERPAAARVLDRRGLDYCCHGAQQLDAACAAAGIDAADVLAELEAEPSRSPEWATMPIDELVDHLESTHHQYLHDELPRLTALVDKVVGVHGARHPELFDIAATYEALRAELEPHLMKEEQVLFPMIRQLAGATEAPTFHCGSIANPIRVMQIEHDDAGELLARLHSLTDGYSPPDDACASYRALYDGLADLQADTHLHVHKENNVLFPAVLLRG